LVAANDRPHWFIISMPSCYGGKTQEEPFYPGFPSFLIGFPIKTEIDLSIFTSARK
jgi:hypothetical protein